MAVLIAVLLLALVGGTAFAVYLHQHSNRSAATPLKPARYAFVFVLDGVGPSDLQSASTPTITALTRAGTSYTNAWVGQVETAAITSNATLGTGLYPRHHGVLGWQWSGRHGGVDAPTSNTQVQLGSLDALMQAHAGDSLAARIKSRYPAYHVLSVAGRGCGVANAAGTWAADYVLCARKEGLDWLPGSVTGHAPPAELATGPGFAVPVAHGHSLGAVTEGWRLGQQDDWVARYAARVLAQTRPRLTIVNFPEVAAVARFAPPNNRAAIVRTLLEGIDRGVGRIVHQTRTMHIFDQSVFLITSDQALAPINRRIRGTLLRRAIVASGGNLLYLASDMSAMIGLGDRLQIPPVVKRIRAVDQRRIDAIFAKTSNRTSAAYRRAYARPGLSPRFVGALRALVDTDTAPGSPDIMTVFAPGVGTGFARAGRFLQTSGELGFQWPNQHIPLIVSGHGVVQGRQSGYPARLIDVAPTIEALLGIHSAGDGIVLADAMYRPPGAATAVQHHQNNRISRLVKALQGPAARPPSQPRSP